MRWWLIAAVVGCTPTEGGDCVSRDENYGFVCSGDRMLACEDGTWVDIGTSVSPDYSDPDVLGGPACECAHSNRIVCTYEEY